MDLQRIVRRCPGHTRAQQLGHSGFQIAPVAVVFFPGTEIGQLTGHHDLDRHHRQLARDPGKADQRLAELLAVLAILHPNFQRVLRHANGARGGLDAGGFERLHQLLEALALDPAQQVLTLDLEPVKAQLVFLHAAIAQHLDFTAGHALGGEGVFFRAGGFLGQEHGQAAMVRRVGIGACQQGHHMCARGVGDPGLVARNLPVSLGIFHGTSAQTAQIRPGVRFGEHGGGQDLRTGQFRQPMRLLVFGAARLDQFGGDLGSGAQRPDPDIAARQFFGHHHHRCLGQAQPAIFLGYGQAEHAHFAQFLDDFHRDQLVPEVPFMGVGDHPLVGIAAELFADHLQLIVQPGRAKGCMTGIVAHQGNQPHPCRLAVAPVTKGADLGRHQPAHVVLTQSKILKPDDLVLAHRDAAVDLPEILTKGDLVQQLLHFAEFALGLQTLGPGLHLAQRLGIGGQPGQTVGGCLVFFDQLSGNFTIFRYGRAHPGGGGFQNRVNRGNRRAGQCQQIGKNNGVRHRQVLSIMGHESSSSFSAV